MRQDTLNIVGGDPAVDLLRDVLGSVAGTESEYYPRVEVVIQNLGAHDCLLGVESAPRYVLAPSNETRFTLVRDTIWCAADIGNDTTISVTAVYV